MHTNRSTLLLACCTNEKVDKIYVNYFQVKLTVNCWHGQDARVFRSLFGEDERNGILINSLRR